MTTKNFKIRSMTEAEIDIALDWANVEGWNPGLNDNKCFYQADPNGFFLGELNGEPVGCISAVRYDALFGFLGLYIVKPSFRGQGYGMQLWQKAISYLGTDCNIALDGVLAQQENYKKSGFQLAYRHVRYEGVGGGLIPPEIVELNTISFEDLLTYDRQCFPAERANFLKAWIEQSKSSALGILEDSQLAGYGVIRPCHIGFKIGPLFANGRLNAVKLLEGLLAKVKDAPVFLDVPDINSVAIQLAADYKMKPVFETARMYTKNPPNLLLERIFGVTTLELG